MGKSCVLPRIPPGNPIVFGSAVCSHPCDDPTLLERFAIRRILVPGEWMREMWADYFGDRVVSWPTGIDVDRWKPDPAIEPAWDVLVYDKVRWEHERYQQELLEPILNELRRRNLTITTIQYGHYREDDFLERLRRVRWMLFVTEHETQGFAYQEALSTGVPVLAWDRGGYWQDPSYFPARVKFSPVSSVPYWDARCGTRFSTTAEFPRRLDEFLEQRQANRFTPRQFILDNLTLERCARHYLNLVEQASPSS
ncbi:MAG: glycosyltransferase [Planctomycetes bacterium]|nr:glycosyltransferase [Planctomycetota bacterium]